MGPWPLHPPVHFTEAWALSVCDPCRLDFSAKRRPLRHRCISSLHRASSIFICPSNSRTHVKNSVVFVSESCDNFGMFRTSVIHLLLLAIIACPFNCMGLFLAIHSVAGGAVVTCTCCAAASGCESAPSTDRDGENSPDELPKGACPSCICHGALVLSYLESGKIELSVSSSPGSVPFCFFLTVQPGARQNDTHFDRYKTPPILSGAFVRISHQSLLI